MLLIPTNHRLNIWQCSQHQLILMSMCIVSSEVSSFNEDMLNLLCAEKLTQPYHVVSSGTPENIEITHKVKEFLGLLCFFTESIKNILIVI